MCVPRTESKEAMNSVQKKSSPFSLTHIATKSARLVNNSVKVATSVGVGLLASALTAAVTPCICGAETVKYASGVRDEYSDGNSHGFTQVKTSCVSTCAAPVVGFVKALAKPICNGISVGAACKKALG